MPKFKTPAEYAEQDEAPKSQKLEMTSEALVDVLTAAVSAAEAARPKKKTIVTRRKNTPWSPPPGVPKLRFKRKFYQHDILLKENLTSNDEIALLNKLRPGDYCDGLVRVIRRKDKGINITYPVRTNSQRHRLINTFGLRNFRELLEYCVAEAARPKPVVNLDVDYED